MVKNSIIRFLLRLTAFCAVLFLVDRALGFAFKTAYYNQKVGQFSQTTYAVDSASQDIMIFGSSRAVRHYSTTIISKTLGMSCYNSGRDGQMIPYSAIVQEVTLNRHKPKLIILDINPWELAKDPSKYEKLSILLPYCDNHPEIVKYMHEIGPFEEYKLWSKVYPYNSSTFILASNTLFPQSAVKDTNGYLPLVGQLSEGRLAEYKQRMEARYERIRTNKEEAEEKGIKYFKQFLDNTHANHIKTLVVISPTVLNNPFELDNNMLERNLVENISRKYPNVTFLDYSKDERFNDHPEKFSDVFHLNQQGSAEFSSIFANYVKTNYLMKF